MPTSCATVVPCHRRCSKTSTQKVKTSPHFDSSRFTLSTYFYSPTMSDQEESTTTVITATTHLDLPAHPHIKTYQELNPRSKPTEFFGPWGTGAITLFTPLFTYFFFFACNDAVGCTPTSVQGWKDALALVGNYPSSAGKLWEWKAAGVYLGWYAFCMICEVVLPGQRVQGNLLRDGRRKVYRMNGQSFTKLALSRPLVVYCLYRAKSGNAGLYTLLLALGLLTGVLVQPRGIQAFTWLHDHFVPLISASLAMATFQAVCVYVWSFFSGELLALGGNSGNVIYDVCP